MSAATTRRHSLEHELAAFSALFRKVNSRLEGRLVTDDPLTDAVVAEAFRRTIDEDPGARELAERLAVIERFRAPHDTNGGE